MDLQRKIVSLHTYKRSVTSVEKTFVINALCMTEEISQNS